MIVTLLTPRGRGAVATVRFEGSGETLDRFFAAANQQPLAVQPVDRVMFGHWGQGVPEDVVVCRTSKNVAEIHCHGGAAATQRILTDLKSAGCRVETWTDAIERTEGRFVREWTETISRATTERTALILLKQRTVFPKTIAALPSLWEDRARLMAELESLLGWANFGRHLTTPWNVVLGGRPNVGKSSLINALVGYVRSIVFDQPGTTRDVVTAETAFEGWPVRLADTAGLREQAEPLEAEGIARAKHRLAMADCRVLVFDTSQPPTDADGQLLAEFPNALLVAHKCDLPNVWGRTMPAEALVVSSLTGEGVDELARRMIERLVPRVPEVQTAVPFTARQEELLERARQAAMNDDFETFEAVLSEISS